MMTSAATCRSYKVLPVKYLQGEEKEFSAFSLLHQELLVVSEWVIENKLRLNESKTKWIVLDSKHSVRPTQMLHISLNGQLIDHLQEAKLLGDLIDQILSRSTHLQFRLRLKYVEIFQ